MGSGWNGLAGPQPQTSMPAPGQVQAQSAPDDRRKNKHLVGVNMLDPNSYAGMELEPGTSMAWMPDDPATVIKNEQMTQAKKFRSSLPELQNQMGNRLAYDANSMMNQQLGAAKQSQSRRGLLYGGLAAGQNAGIRAGAATQLAQARSGMNQSLGAFADQLDADAISTAQGVQRNAQAIQDQIYSRALASMNADNSMIANIASTAALAAFL